MYHYIRTEKQLWTVGTGSTIDRSWEPESDHDSEESAAKRVAFLNGNPVNEVTELKLRIASLEKALQTLQERVGAIEDHEPSEYECALIVERANSR